jgi:hypothetical protein
VGVVEKMWMPWVPGSNGFVDNLFFEKLLRGIWVVKETLI